MISKEHDAPFHGPPHLPNLNPFDLFIWWALKHKVSIGGKEQLWKSIDTICRIKKDSAFFSKINLQRTYEHFFMREEIACYFVDSKMHY